MPIEKIDFQNVFVKEGEPFYSEIHGLDKEEFNNWVAENFNNIGIINSFSQTLPSDEILKLASDKGYKHRPSQCHYSAKAICLLNKNIEFFTGFINCSDILIPIKTHSFNYFDKRIIDFARLNENLVVREDDYNSYLPHNYYGINIPREFILNFENETFENFSMRPLLFEWYMKIKSS